MRPLKDVIRQIATALTLVGLLTLAPACAERAPEATPTPSAPTATATPVPGYDLAQDPYIADRQRMVAETIVARDVTDPDVLDAMRTVPRHRFVEERYRNQAYADHPLPIGYGQTISQPYIVAWMTELLALEAGDKVLEIGTGSGYQAAVLAELGDVEVYTIEIIPELAAQAEARLEALGYTDVHVRQGDGYDGWEAHAPYDAIIVTAAPDHLPQPLVAQLKEGGRLVIPIGPPGGYQDLWQFTKEDGELQARNLGGVMFVPFTGEGVQDADVTVPAPTPPM
jgi:protein-L-isoaspartate(D-aspartate) O-methyltransferase